MFGHWSSCDDGQVCCDCRHPNDDGWTRSSWALRLEARTFPVFLSDEVHADCPVTACLRWSDCRPYGICIWFREKSCLTLMRTSWAKLVSHHWSKRCQPQLDYWLCPSLRHLLWSEDSFSIGVHSLQSWSVFISKTVRDCHAFFYFLGSH